MKSFNRYPDFRQPENSERRPFPELEFVSVPDPLFCWTKEDILLWTKLRHSENTEDVSEAYRMTSYYQDVYRQAISRFRR